MRRVDDGSGQQQREQGDVPDVGPDDGKGAVATSARSLAVPDPGARKTRRRPRAPKYG